jgi:hypothetical protein
MDRDRFTFRDVTQTLRAFKAAGVSIARVEVHRDGVIVIPGEPTDEVDREVDDETIQETLRKFRNATTGKAPGRRAK